MIFKELGLIDEILKAVEEAGYESPTPIQEQAIPVVLQGRDVLGCAQTGTGKTAAFAIPILQNVFNKHGKNEGKKTIKTVVLAPTRELAIQINESFDAYSKYTGIKNIVIFGGVNQKPQVRDLRAGADVLIATPGRMLDLMNQKYIDLSEVEYFVLDEADRMLDMGMIHDVKKIISKLPKERQNLLFSATMPKEVTKLVNSILKDQVRIEVAPVSSTIDTITQGVYFVSKKQKKNLLIHLLKDEAIQALLVFTRTKRGANMITKDLVQVGIEAQAIHGNKSQNARQLALNNFKEGKIRVLVATDIAARGIDVDELSYVVNLDLPEVPETYVHRIGRTGRAGNTGVAYSFCDEEERGYLRDIEKVIKIAIPRLEAEGFKEVAIPGTQAAQPQSTQRTSRDSSESRNRNYNRGSNGTRRASENRSDKSGSSSRGRSNWSGKGRSKDK